MTNHILALAAMQRAQDALTTATTELTLAMLTSPDGALAMDACVLAEAIELEAAALGAKILRRSASGRG
jgi:hypothetical protein